MATDRLSTGITLTWNSTSVLNVVDVNQELDGDPQDATNQASGGYRNFIAGIRKGEISITVQWIERDQGTVPAVTIHSTLLTDQLAGTKRTAVFVFPGTITYTGSSVLLGPMGWPIRLGTIVQCDLKLMGGVWAQT